MNRPPQDPRADKTVSRRKVLRFTSRAILLTALPGFAWRMLGNDQDEDMLPEKEQRHSSASPAPDKSEQVSESAFREVPACRYESLPATFQSYDDWQYTLVDTSYHLPPDYVPPDLVSVSHAGFSDDRSVREFMIPDLRALGEAANQAGNPLAILSVYRSYQYQQQVFQHWSNQYGVEQARRVSARAGHSEHQLGTAIDFGSAGGPASWDLEDWAQTPAGAWMMEHAWRYGFILSYPKDSFERVCYIYEPWHYRYMGRELAAEIRASGLTLREWLWQQQV